MSEVGGGETTIAKGGMYMELVFHADDYGITTWQAKKILELSSSCGGQGVLSSVSIFANSPAFDEAAAAAAPFVSAGALSMALHVNLVEGSPCAQASEVPLLVGDRGTFSNDFVGLLKLSAGPSKRELRRQVQVEVQAQLSRFLGAFPQLKSALRIDSHQHTHAVPAVLDGILDACAAEGCTLEHLRCPAEPLGPHRACKSKVEAVNRVKVLLIDVLWRKNRSKVPAGCKSPLFCGVALSGHMDQVTWPLVDAFCAEAARRHATGVEVLFHPVSVPVAECLDPQNTAFAEACAGPGRDAEAACVRNLATR